MAQQVIGIGAAANDGLGDPLRTGGQKVNSNFTELYLLFNTITVLPSGVLIQSLTPGLATRVDLRMSLNQFIVRREVNFTDFGTGQVDNLYLDFDSNPNHESAAHPRFAHQIENFFDTGSERLLEDLYTYDSPGNTLSYRPWQRNINIDTHEASENSRVGRIQIGNRLGGTGDFVQDVIDVHTERNGVDFPGAVGFGGTARQHILNGPVVLVRGSAGTGLSHLQIQPDLLAESSTVCDVTILAGLGATTATGYSVVSTLSGELLDLQRVTHATGVLRALQWTVGGDLINDHLASPGRYADGIDASESAYSWDLGFTLGADRVQTISLATGLHRWFRPTTLWNRTVAEAAGVTPTAGAQIFVTDEAGGSVPAFGDGTNWRRVTDRAIVS